MIDDYLRKFQRLLIISLMVMMSLVVLLATIDLGVIITQAVLRPPRFLFDVK